MAKANLKKFGYERIFVSVNGTSVQLIHGQHYTNEKLLADFAKYFDEVAEVSEVSTTKKEKKVEAPKAEPKVEVVETKEEILVEDSAKVEVQVTKEKAEE